MIYIIVLLLIFLFAWNYYRSNIVDQFDPINSQDLPIPIGSKPLRCPGSNDAYCSFRCNNGEYFQQCYNEDDTSCSFLAIAACKDRGALEKGDFCDAKYWTDWKSDCDRFNPT